MLLSYGESPEKLINYIIKDLSNIEKNRDRNGFNTFVMGAAIVHIRVNEAILDRIRMSMP